jgi:hypothetical protein
VAILYNFAAIIIMTRKQQEFTMVI